MPAGKRRHYFEVQKPVDVVDARGDPTRTWTRVRNVWGSLDILSRKDVLFGGRELTEATHKIEVPYDTSNPIKQDWRLLKGTRVFNVSEAINVQERNKDLMLVCAEQYDGT